MLTILEPISFRMQKLCLVIVDNTGEPLKKIWNTHNFVFQVGLNLLLLSIHNNHSYPSSFVRFFDFTLEVNSADNLHEVQPNLASLISAISSNN